MNESIVRHRVVLGLLVAIVAVLGSVTTFANYFAQDDVPLVMEDARAHSPGLWQDYLDEAYWPAPYLRFLYRPLTSLLIGSEYWIGGGVPFPFKAIQVALYAATAIAVFALALRLLSPWAALAISILFAAHPVHVEAVALAVNQGEVMVGLLAVLAAAWYLDRRRRGALSVREHVTLAAVTLIAAHFKESGIMIPGLLFALELTVIRQPPWRERVALIRPLVLWQTLAVVLTVAFRSRIEFFETSGTFVAEAFLGLPLGSRFLTMLSVVPEWLRLLLWPAILAADYSPRRILPADSWGLDQTLGLAILLLIGTLAWRLRHRTPVITLGILWCALALFPVSNVILPTGIALAERTLFLPSVGVMLVVGGVLMELPKLATHRRRVVHWLIATFVALVTVLGVSRSISRHRVWSTSFTLWGQTVIDVPTSYRAWVALGALVNRMGHRDRAIMIYEEAYRLWGGTSGPVWQLAEWYRLRGDCELAIPLYYRTIELTQFAPARASLISCLVDAGEYPAARTLALEGIREGAFTGIFRTWVRTIDVAIRTNAPAGTVRYDHTLTGGGKEVGQLPLYNPR